MFYYVKGAVAHVAPYLAVIACGGVGYACHTTNNTISALTVGQAGKLPTYLNVREDVVELYGFAPEDGPKCFQLPHGGSGGGAKAGTRILSSAAPDRLALAIITGDEKALTVAQGIGKKIAQRIILELKDKLAKGQRDTMAGESYGGTGVTLIPENKVSEASAALAVLGYGPSEVSLALKGVDVENLKLEDIIKQALKKMVK